VEGIITVRKYIIKFDVDDNVTDTQTGSENEACMVQHKVKKQVLIIMDMWSK
jgi:hypothetical protein